MNKKAIITLGNIVKTFFVKKQTVTILHGIDLQIYEGDFSVVFGPSGCGKSTMLHAILGLEKPTKGKVVFFDKDLYKFSEDERSNFRKNNIGMIYQQPNWIKSLTVAENIAFASSLLGNSKSVALTKARKMLEVVDLLDWADYYPSELSSGQQQKVALARALITNPKVIIADEPTGNLDYESGVELMELFQKLNKQGVTIIMVTHNIENVEYAKNIIQMFNGRVVRVLETKGMKADKLKDLLLEKVKVDTQTTVKVREPQEDIPKTRNYFSFLKFLNPIFLFKGFLDLLSFVSLLFIYIAKKITEILVIPKKLKSKIISSYDSVIRFLDNTREKTISRVDLVDLSIKNMLSKKARTIITVGGITIGISVIVFLISIGYGLEKLVVNRVARLEEMKQIDASPAVATNIVLNDKSIASIKNIITVEKILPVIGVVGKINYQNSSTDVAVYGVQADYLKESAIKPARGEIFTENEMMILEEARVIMVEDLEGEVTGEPVEISSTESGQEIRQTLEDTPNLVELEQVSNQAVVNEAFLRTLGIIEGVNAGIGEVFTVSFIATKDVLREESSLESTPVQYTIIGVTNESDNPLLYVPINDLKQMGIQNYTQAKIIVGNQDNLDQTRKQIELQGFKTSSVVDTVAQIEGLFTSLRYLLGVLGFVALFVASLGMLNTLTVSLLERTREVGMMKAIGMKSQEVKSLYLTESMLMGFFGGVGGLFLGFVAGKILSTILSGYAMSRGYEFLDITFIPTAFIVVILLISVFVGLLTGIYPARRATRISALDALRYE